METRIIESAEDKQKVEKLRSEVFHMDSTGTYYLNELLNNKEYAIVSLENNEMLAGCYFHRFDNILVIDQLFVKEKYQNTGLKLGRELIKKLILSKESIEKLLGGKLELCKIESQNEKAHNIYSKMGFYESKYDEDTFYKSI